MRQDQVGVEARVPDVDGAKLGHLEHVSRYERTQASDDRASRRGVEAAVAGGDLEARGEALDVPLPRPRQRLVEVVDVEDEAPLRRLVETEVHQVGVAAELRRQPGVGRAGEVGRHDQGAAAVEGERRGEHAPVADGHELGGALRGLLLEQATGSGRRRAAFHAACAERGALLRARPCRARHAPPACPCVAGGSQEGATSPGFTGRGTCV